MRKLKLEVQLSIDGFAADEHGKTDWMLWDWQPSWNWDRALQNFHTRLQTTSDTVLFGKAMASGGFYEHWETIARKKGPQATFANAILKMKPYIFSRTLLKSPFSDVELVNSGLKKAISGLKRQKGKDIIVYGGTRFVSALIAEDLIDEYNLIINPTILGKGKPIFKKISSLHHLQLIKATAYRCGVAVLIYKRNSK